MEYLIEDFPRDAIDGCTGPGPADDAVDFWVDELNFQPPTESTRLYLREFGAWDDEELADVEQNRRRLFWTMMCDFAEWDGKGADSECGSDCIYLPD